MKIKIDIGGKKDDNYRRNEIKLIIGYSGGEMIGKIPISEKTKKTIEQIEERTEPIDIKEKRGNRYEAVSDIKNCLCNAQEALQAKELIKTGFSLLWTNVYICDKGSLKKREIYESTTDDDVRIMIEFKISTSFDRLVEIALSDFLRVMCLDSGPNPELEIIIEK